MKVGENMFVFLIDDRLTMRCKEWVHDLKYDIELDRYYIESYCANANGNIVSHSVFQLDRDGIVFLCKLLARFRSLRH